MDSGELTIALTKLKKNAVTLRIDPTAFDLAIAQSLVKQIHEYLALAKKLRMDQLPICISLQLDANSLDRRIVQIRNGSSK